MSIGCRSVLPNDYYLKNFRTLVSFVGNTYSSLLSADERCWASKLSSASEPAQRLYIRLLGRQASVFRIGKLDYPEIPGLSAAIVELESLSLASCLPPDDLQVLLQAFTKSELLRLLENDGLKKQRRAELVDTLLARHEVSDITALQAADHWLNILGHEYFSVYRLCFFGNLYQDTTEFVLRDLGTVRYEAYVIDAESCAFQTREEIDAQLRYFECDVLAHNLPPGDSTAIMSFHESLPLRDSGGVLLRRRVDRLRNQLARELERLQCLTDALSLYELSERPPSRERQVRILASLEREHDAYHLCQRIYSGPCTDEERQFAESMMNKLAPLCGKPAIPVSRHKPATTRLTLKRGGGRVELVACEFYSRFGECFYVENGLITGVLGLFIWDIVYLPLPGVFFNPFQSAPADFHEAEFCIRRAAHIRARLEELADPVRFASRVWENYENKHGIVNPLVNWSVLSEPLLTLAMVRIPTDHWSNLFNRMLDDLRNNCNGLPDLVLFPEAGGYELLEIKGPGDALQKNQRRWMRFFSAQRIPCRVVNVQWRQDAPTEKLQ